MKTLNELLNFLKEIYPSRWCVAGGAARASLEGTQPRDVDIFCWDSYVAGYLKGKLNNEGFYSQRVESVNMFKLSKGNMKVDIIVNTELDSPEKVIDEFDFTCVMGYYYKGGWTYTEEMKQAVSDKKLHLHNMKYPYAFLRRIQQYALKGYSLSEEAATEFVDLLMNGEEADFCFDYSFSDPEHFPLANYNQEMLTTTEAGIRPEERPSRENPLGTSTSYQFRTYPIPF